MFHRSWRRELAFELGLLGVGLAVGFVLRAALAGHAQKTAGLRLASVEVTRMPGR